MTTIDALVRRAWIRLDDRLRFSRVVSECIAAANYLAYLVRSHAPPRAGVARDAALLFRAARFTRSPRLRTALRNALRPVVTGGDGGAFASTTGQVRGTEPAHGAAVRSVLLLKPAGPGGEKGVLFAGNEIPWPALADVARRTPLLERYDLVALSAWSPPRYEKLAQFIGSRDPVFVGISNPDDMTGYALLAPAIVPIPLMASDWLNPEDFSPRPRTERDIDILMVAGWGRYKRHWLLFQALRDLPHTLNVVLIGRDSGSRTVDHVRAEARMFGVPQDLTYLTDVPIHEVYAYQGRARVSMILSGREGACVAVTESFFADTPVAVMSDAHIGSRVHINAETGVLLSRDRLGRQVGRFLEASDAFRPRAWAIANISCERSSARLNELLRQRAIAAGRPWTADLAPLFRRYFVPRYLRSSDEKMLAGGRAELRDRYGVTLIPPDET